MQPPEFVRRERYLRRAYPKSFQLEGSNLELRYRISRVSSVGWEDGAIFRTTLFGWLVRETKKVGAFEFVSYDPNGCFDNSHIIGLMDADYGYEARLSCAVCSAWEDLISDVTSFGPLLSFQHAWIAPNASCKGLFANVSEKIIDRHFDDYSILVLFPYPLEYEGCVETRWQARAAAIRQKAMIRYYQSALGVKLLPGRSGREGWLWRASPRFHIAQPRARRNPF